MSKSSQKIVVKTEEKQDMCAMNENTASDAFENVKQKSVKEFVLILLREQIMRIEIEENNRNQKKMKRFKCDLCELKFTFLSELKTHLWNHSQAKLFQCSSFSRMHGKNTQHF